MEKALPKSLWRFYFQYAARPMLWFLLAWAILFIVCDIASSTWWPISQQKIVALFEDGIAGLFQVRVMDNWYYHLGVFSV